jgi:hypothetical protein
MPSSNCFVHADVAILHVPAACRDFSLRLETDGWGLLQLPFTIPPMILLVTALGLQSIAQSRRSPGR